MADFLPEEADLARWNAWFTAFSNNEKIKPVLGKVRSDNPNLIIFWIFFWRTVIDSPDMIFVR